MWAKSEEQLFRVFLLFSPLFLHWERREADSSRAPEGGRDEEEEGKEIFFRAIIICLFRVPFFFLVLFLFLLCGSLGDGRGA